MVLVKRRATRQRDAHQHRAGDKVMEKRLLGSAGVSREREAELLVKICDCVLRRLGIDVMPKETFIVDERALSSR